LKKQKVEVEKYTLTGGDVNTILGLTGNQKITDMSSSHSTSGWGLVITVETVQTTELPVPTHKHT
jgi:hypothetical protein